jgi:hypothetical protein
MSLGSRDASKAIARAERAVLAIKQVEQTYMDAAAEGQTELPSDDLASALDAFAELEALTAIHLETEDVARAAVCGSVRLAAVGRSIGKLDLVRRVNGLLARLAQQPSPDAVTRRAFAEASNDLMLAEADADQLDAAIETYFGIAALSDTYPTDSDLTGARAKAAANLIALTLEAGRDKVADLVMRELEALCRTFPAEKLVALQMARGRFNRLAWTARNGSPDAAIAELETLFESALRSPADVDMLDITSDAAFVLVTRLGTRQHHKAARKGFDVLSKLAAFNLITDLCENDRRDEAQLIYDDLAGLSVAEDDNAKIRLAQAKGAANLAMTHEAVGDVVAAELLTADLRALVHAHPDDMAIFEIAALVDQTN